MTDELPQLPRRARDSHKGDFGRAVLAGGSRGMTGAIALAGVAALRGGAGLVTLAVPDCCLEVVAGFEPCYMTVPVPCDQAGRFSAAAFDALPPLLARATAAAIGPGLGRSDSLTRGVRACYASLASPLVVDADALNALAAHPDGLAGPGGPRIITPHPGEWDRLCPTAGRTTQEREERAIEVAARLQIVVVLKGHRTLITDGTRSAHNQTGNPGMATGGVGDVLTGLITALLCQGLGPWEAARLAVHVHGLAGDLAARQLTEVAMVASDLLRVLPAAFAQLSV